MKIAHCLTLIHCFCFLVSKFACCRFCKSPASKISSKQRFYLIKLVFYSISRQNEPLFWANSTNIPFLRNCSPIITFARYFKNPSRCIKELGRNGHFGAEFCANPPPISANQSMNAFELRGFYVPCHACLYNSRKIILFLACCSPLLSNVYDRIFLSRIYSSIKIFSMQKQFSFQNWRQSWRPS